MFKHVQIVFLISILLLVGLLMQIGCGGDDDDNDDSDAPISDDDADDDVDDDADDDINDDVDDDIDDDSGDDDTTEDICDPDPLVDMSYDETPEPGTLRQKAVEYDLWHEQWHQPNYGSTVEVTFTDENRTEVAQYGGTGDSCMWTGTYLASQAFRYHVTKDEQAKQNVMKSVRSLDRHLHVTGRPGFIARYVGPMSDPAYGDVQGRCDSEPEYQHCLDDGEFAGDFWKGNTSRDQYTGWFFGMALAYDLLGEDRDEEAQEVRTMIQADVTEVLDALMEQYWRIIDVDGIATTAGPGVLPTMQQSWALIGYNITGLERFKEIFEFWANPARRPMVRAMNISFMNRYAQHYGLNLAHQNFFNLMRLSRPYCQANEFIKRIFSEQMHYHVDLSHNAFFTLIHMIQSDLEDEEYWQAQYDQMLQDLSDFRDAPNDSYYMEPPDAPIDPISVLLYELQQNAPWLAEIMGTVHVQALDAYPVPFQCTTDFLWQRNPWDMGPCGADYPQHVNPGADYLVAYWMASAYGLITKDM